MLTALHLKQKWRAEQVELSKQLVEYNDFPWTLDTLHYIGGVDISFAQDSKVDACASIVICKFPSLEVVYEVYYMIKLTAPCIQYEIYINYISIYSWFISFSRGKL